MGIRMNMKLVSGFLGLALGCIVSLYALAEEHLSACRLMAVSSADDRAVVLCNGKMETLASGGLLLDKQFSVMQILTDKLVLRDQETKDMIWMQLSVNNAPSFIQRFSTKPDKTGNFPVQMQLEPQKPVAEQNANVEKTTVENKTKTEKKANTEQKIKK